MSSTDPIEALAAPWHEQMAELGVEWFDLGSAWHDHLLGCYVQAMADGSFQARTVTWVTASGSTTVGVFDSPVTALCACRLARSSLPTVGSN